MFSQLGRRLTKQTSAQDSEGSPEFEVSWELDDGVRVVHVTGELDLLTADRLTTALTEAVNGGGAPIVLDLGGCTFIDSSGLRAVLLGHRELGGGSQKPARLAIVATDAQVTRVLEITGIDDLIPVAPDFAEARSKLV